ncbi:MAG: response regulator transcription factor [Chloroflexota bacterium]|nr:response regulator transcription factor [Chloroflexota bacterium]
MTSLLLIERNGEFSADLAKRYDVTLVSSGKQALALDPNCCELILLDSVSLRTPGERIARSLKNHFESVPLIHLTMAAKSEGTTPADLVLAPPISARKLHNALLRLLAHTSKAHELVEYGPFAVDLKRRLLLIRGQEMPLTPKLARLLEVFMRNPGETLDRRVLMESVWQTDYLGDTRTLDVHVRWIRRAIEHDPSSPRYLITVRGVGYRFDLPALPVSDSTVPVLTLPGTTTFPVLQEA